MKNTLKGVALRQQYEFKSVISIYPAPRLIHADGRSASYSSLKHESFPVVARDESKRPFDRLRRRRFTQRVTHVPRQVIEFLRYQQRGVWKLAPVFARLGE